MKKEDSDLGPKHQIVCQNICAGTLSDIPTRKNIPRYFRVCQQMVHVLEQPWQNPDFNTKDNLWRVLKTTGMTKKPSHLKNLKNLAEVEWIKIPIKSW